MADDDVDLWPLDVGSAGSLHDLGDFEPAPRLWGMRSVSKAAARALDTRVPVRPRPIGFVRGRVR